MSNRSLRTRIARPSNQPFPLYLRLRYASNMFRLTDFPNLLGRVNRKTPVSRWLRMSSMNADLSTK